MHISKALSYAQAEAITPDQLISYVSSVSNAKSELIGDYILHKQGQNFILVAYSLQDPHNTEHLDEVIAQVLAQNEVYTMIVLAPIRPKSAPVNAVSIEDSYWFLPIPWPKINLKTRNMLKRAERELYIKTTNSLNAWTSEHQELMLSYIRNKGMDSALCTIMQGIEKYLLNEKGAELFSAYSKLDNRLLGCAVADFSSYTTAFYMFAFKEEIVPVQGSEKIVPGIADALLFALIKDAQSKGYTQCNLGLGINDGIRFFKQKWGAEARLPFVQTTWRIGEEEKAKTSWFSKLFS